MSSLIEMLIQQAGPGALSQISGQLGADENATGQAVAAALPLLLGALNRNASDSAGAESLFSAVSKDHDGSILDDLGGFLSNADEGPGAGILGHVLGNRQPAVERGISKSTGLDAGSVAKLLAMLAPVVMGALGKTQRANNLDAGGLAGLLGEENDRLTQQQPAAMGVFGKLLDADQDGDVDAGDLASQGMALLGKFLGGS
jgi:hypothetical protein